MGVCVLLPVSGVSATVPTLTPLLFNCGVSAYGWLKGACKELVFCAVTLGAATLTGAVTITGNDDTLGCTLTVTGNE